MTNKAISKLKVIIPLVLMLLAVWLVSAPPPTPHSISGYIFESDGITQVQLGTNYSVNDTTSGDYVSSYTVLPVPEMSGYYFELMTGYDNDVIAVEAWNSTHYGEATAVLIGDMENVNINLDQQRQPETNITILLPDWGSLLNMTYPFNLTADIRMLIGSGTGCSATIGFSNPSLIMFSSGDQAAHQLGDISIGSSVITAWNLTPLQQGNISISIEAKCSNTGKQFENLYFDSATYTIQDITSPMVALVSPLNNSWAKPNVTFIYNASDLTGIANCSIFLDGVLNATNSSVRQNQFEGISVENIPEGNHYWSISCFDNSTNSNHGNSTSFNITVDGTLPVVSLLTPLDQNVSTPNIVEFNYSVTENRILANCSLLINGLFDQKNSSIIVQGIPQSFTKTFRNGNYSWLVSCTDAAGNTYAPEPRQINITDPDIQTNNSVFMISSHYPIENQEITLNATISNIGDEAANNFVVQFFENNPLSGGLQIGQNFTISLLPGGSTSLNVSWTARVGNFDFYVTADSPIATNGSIEESNESNNYANINLTVSMWQFFYGNVVSDILLASEGNMTVFKWGDATNLSKNMYAADSDSRINWSGLQALGINSSGNISLADFEIADNALNTTGYTDSINRTYILRGQRKNVSDFTVYGLPIQNVSIVQSTNNSNFITGILWDSSGSLSGHYDGTQSLVFVTKLNIKTEGAFGVYDYEMRVPAKLRSYVIPDLQNTITFFTDLN